MNRTRDFFRVWWSHGAIALVAVLFAAGCATLFNKSSKSIMMSSRPVGAEVWVNGSLKGVTPVSLDLNNHKDHTVIFRREGHEDVVCQLTASPEAKWIILDVVLALTLVPLIVDAATGNWKSLDQEACHASLPDLRGSNWNEDEESLRQDYTGFSTP